MHASAGQRLVENRRIPVIPEMDLRRIEQFCAAQWPERFHTEVFWECHVRGKNATICETRAP